MTEVITAQIRNALQKLGADPALAQMVAADPHLAYDALEKLGADRFLLAAVGSWADTADDETVLSLLREWNSKGRIDLDEIYASTSPRRKRRHLRQVKK